MERDYQYSKQGHLRPISPYEVVFPQTSVWSNAHPRETIGKIRTS